MNEFELRDETPMPDSSVLKSLHKKEEAETMASRWTTASKKWAKESSLAYLSNPASRRDFKVQFRNGKSTAFIALYVLSLGAATLYEYYKVSTIGGDPAEVQRILLEFYNVIIIGLGIVVTMVAPALSATAIVIEKQRRSLDLVFVTPVRPKVYLIGKLMSSFRFIWILLAMSVPFTAICVLMGGATWLDVISAYALLSLQALLFTGIGSLFSARCEKPLSALIYTYTTIVAYVYLLTMIASAFLGGGAGMGALGKVLAALDPFMLLKAVGETIPVFGVPVPVFLAGSAVLLGLTKLCMSAAGSVLGAYNLRDRKSLRLSAASGLAVLAGIASYAAQANDQWSLILTMLPLLIFMPFLSTYGNDGERRSRENGLFSIRETFKGTPAGALPFVYLTISMGVVATVIGQILNGHFAPANLAAPTFYTFGLWTFGWASGRLASSFSNGVRASQVLQAIIFASVVIAPLPIISLLASAMNVPGANNNGLPAFPWSLWLLIPALGAFSAAYVATLGAILFLISWVFTTYSEINRKRAQARQSAQTV